MHQRAKLMRKIVSPQIQRNLKFRKLNFFQNMKYIDLIDRVLPVFDPIQDRINFWDKSKNKIFSRVFQ